MYQLCQSKKKAEEREDLEQATKHDAFADKCSLWNNDIFDIITGAIICVGYNSNNQVIF